MATREELLQSIATTARWNGGSIVAVASLGALLSTGFAAAFGLAVAAGGLAELVAGREAPRRPLFARSALVGSQLWIMALIGGYALWRLATLDETRILAELGPDVLAMLGAPAEDPAFATVLLQAFRLVYVVLLLVTLVYQGGMAVHYRRKVTRALGA